MLNNHRIDFYNADWELQSIRCQYPNSEEKIKKTVNFNKMFEIATDLSNEFPHVRVDFYEYDDVLKIGELTFFDGSGFYNFNPDKYDFVFGEELILPEPNYNLKLFKQINERC